MERARRFAKALAPAVESSAYRGCSSMAEQKLPKLTTRVRFPSPAPLPARANVGAAAWSIGLQGEAAVESDIAIAHSREVSIPSGHVALQGILEVPDAALGFVLFAH